MQSNALFLFAPAAAAAAASSGIAVNTQRHGSDNQTPSTLARLAIIAVTLAVVVVGLIHGRVEGFVPNRGDQQWMDGWSCQSCDENIISFFFFGVSIAHRN